MIVKNLRSKIPDLREAKGLTQLDLALEVGVTETTIANWEKGRSGLPMILQLIKLCRALNCHLEDLVEVFDPDDTISPIEMQDLSLEEIHKMLGVRRGNFRGS